MNVLIVTDYSFPYGEAWSMRANCFYKLLKRCGFCVTVLARLADNVNDIGDVCCDVEYVKFNYNSIKAYTIDKRKAYVEAIEKCIKEKKIDIILSSNMDYVYSKIIKIAKKNGIPYVMEQCEWYDVSSFPGGYFNPKYWLYKYDMAKGYSRCDGIIAISTYLENYYKYKRKAVIRIPALSDVSLARPCLKLDNNNCISLGICGSIVDGKENVKAVIEAIGNSNKYNKNIVLHLYGPEEEELIKAVGKRAYYESKEYVIVHGRIPQKEVPNVIKKLDYTFVVRPDRRSSHAGFPTKLVESFSVGTPCICNITGDIELYVKDGYNGIVVENDSAGSIVEAINKIVLLEDKEKNEMRNNAFNSAIDNFSYEKYSKQIKCFFEMVMNN